MLHLQKRYSYLLLFLFLPALCFTQELNYVHYDTKDGLAGSTVYDLCQDKDGFIWFGTENGLSRFDGTNFRNYTVKDGLPDNEILRVMSDSKGRVWIVSFNRELAFYYKGKIYNKTNNKVVRQLDFVSVIASIDENEGSLIFSDQTKAMVVDPNDSVKVIVDAKKMGLRDGAEIMARKDYFGRGFLLIIDEHAYFYKNGVFRYYAPHPASYERHKVAARTTPQLKQIWVDIPYNYINYKETGFGSTIFVNTYSGSLMLDTNTCDIRANYLPGKKVSRSMIDNEKSIWFTTLGEGVFKLFSEEIKTYKIKSKEGRYNNEVFSLSMHNNKLFCGRAFSEAVIMKDTQHDETLSFENYLERGENRDISNRLYCSNSISDNIMLLGFDAFLVKLENNKSLVKYTNAVKAIKSIDKDFVMVGTSTFTYKIRVSDLEIVDTIWRSRSTSLFYHNDKYYIGTTEGLYEVDKDKKAVFLGAKNPMLSRRVTDIKAGEDGSLYIATSDNGIVIYKDDQVKTVITEDNGLSSNICRTLYMDGKFLWVGTNRGLNKIDINKTNYPVLKYSIGDGLPSDIINAVYVQDSTIWIGSPAGLSSFQESNISRTSMCNIKMTNITVSGKHYEPEEMYGLPYSTKNISFEFAGISFKSGNDIVYYYKLDGLDDDWKDTRQNNLAYQSLPSGDYELQLYAVNKFGKKSDMISISFSIKTPFWKEWWFYAVIFLAAVSLTAWLVNRRSRKILEVREEKNRVQQQFASLEQQALQAQMNPHFIFNCLNSIQQYILTNDKEKANQYLTGFASLVRQTLDNSSKRTIRVAEEVAYLTKYLEMEEMRFGDNFMYEIVVDESVNPETMEIPALLLQPYVENCLRHGIRYKLHGTGKVYISFKVIDNVLYCTVRDNGIGRQKASELKSRQHIEYQSRGMKLTAKRIELLNKINDNHVTAEIIDLKDEEGNAAGTEVIVKIPLNDHE